MIRNIIFDVGNVLVDYDPEKFLDRRGYGEEERRAILAAVFHHPLWLDADRGLIRGEELLRGFAANAPGREELIRQVWEHAEETVEEMPYAKSWAKELKERGYRLYVLSNYGEDLYRRTKEKMPFLPYMDGALFSFQCGLLKPEWEMYQYLCDTYGLTPAESIFLDDSAANVEGARRIGISGIHFTGYEEARRRLEQVLELYDGDDRMVYCCE